MLSKCRTASRGHSESLLQHTEGQCSQQARSGCQSRGATGISIFMSLGSSCDRFWGCLLVTSEKQGGVNNSTKVRTTLLPLVPYLWEQLVADVLELSDVLPYMGHRVFVYHVLSDQGWKLEEKLIPDLRRKKPSLRHGTTGISSKLNFLNLNLETVLSLIKETKNRNITIQSLSALSIINNDKSNIIGYGITRTP